MFTGKQTSLRMTTKELQSEEYDTFQSFLCESRAVTLTSNLARDLLTLAWVLHYTDLSRVKNICVCTKPDSSMTAGAKWMLSSLYIQIHA